MIVEGQGMGLWTRVRLPPIPFIVVRRDPRSGRIPYHSPPGKEGPRKWEDSLSHIVSLDIRVINWPGGSAG